MFVDVSSSQQRRGKEHGVDVVPCILPSHPVWSTSLHRFVQPREFLGLQAIWECDAPEPEIFRQMIQKATFCQDMAGNSFTGTVVQAVCLATLSTASTWLDVRCGQAHSPDSTSSVVKMESEEASKRESMETVEESSVENGKGNTESLKRKASSSSDLVLPMRRVRGKKPPSLLSVKIKSKRGAGGKGNCDGKGKSPMASIYDKEQIFQAYAKAVADGVAKPLSAVKDMKGYFAGCLYESKWGASRRLQQWTLLCASAPQVCKKHKELPNSIRRILNLTLKHSKGQADGQPMKQVPFALQEVVEQMVMTRIEAGEEVGMAFVKHTLKMAIDIWNESIETMREMVKTKGIEMMQSQDEQLAKMSVENINKVYGSLAENAEKLLQPIHLLGDSDSSFTPLGGSLSTVLSFENLFSYVLSEVFARKMRTAHTHTHIYI